MGTDEIRGLMHVGALLGDHWNDHAGQLARIRQAVGLATSGPAVKPTGVPIQTVDARLLDRLTQILAEFNAP